MVCKSTADPRSPYSFDGVRELFNALVIFRSGSEPRCVLRRGHQPKEPRRQEQSRGHAAFEGGVIDDGEN